MNETENDRLRRAVERLMDGQREALDVLEQALEGAYGEAEGPGEYGPDENTLAELQDILAGASSDASAILETDEEAEA